MLREETPCAGKLCDSAIQGLVGGLGVGLLGGLGLEVFSVCNRQCRQGWCMHSVHVASVWSRCSGDGLACLLAA